MTHETDDPTDLERAEPSAEPVVEQSLDEWAESAAEPTWTSIGLEGEPSGAGPAGPAPDQTVADAGASEETAADGSEETVTGDASDAAEQPSAAPKPRPAAAPAPAPAAANPYAAVRRSASAPRARRARRPSALRAALDERAAEVPRRRLSPPAFMAGDATPGGAPAGLGVPAAPPAPTAPPGPSLPQRFVALTDQRPEVGLAAAFLGGLLLATIIKRLGRR